MFAIHSFDASALWSAVGALAKIPMLVRRENDSYIEWAEPIVEDDPAHVVVCVGTLDEAKRVATALNDAGLPATITKAADYSVSERTWNTGLFGWAEWLRDARTDLFESRSREHLLND